MSAFLGPIHYWLYNKIQLQEELIQDILSASETNGWDTTLGEKADMNCGVAERRPLEEIIDQSNIHGWLQYQIGISEARLAFIVTSLLKEDENRLEELKKIAFSFGTCHAVAKGAGADEAFKLLNDSLLDGMPCDRVNEPMEQSAERAVWRQTICIHQEYWDEVEGDIKVYYTLRSQMIKGMLSESGLVLEESETGIRKIKKED
ncbi:hypothetical protein [Konateibacter massiliensis]|uniref:hypothetical protein n=1 Tax=Konateibacter massiliensis TaxID=2002841 RepID=UPI000C14FA22|nr:hypothetical protein [Konateibacter massiliensis]